MVDASTELLGGAAVTVFLALLFFGVVVLWDVALALRSVGDKIDKLEDNIDDDLTDIAHSLDNMSNAPGGGGGTQLHLSGGTISSGGGPNQQQAQQPQQAGQQQAAGPQQAAASQTGSPGAPGAGPQSQSQYHQQPRAASERTGSREERASNEPSADPDADPSDEARGREPADQTDEPDEGDTEASVEEAVSEDASASDAEPDADDDRSRHPRAEHNRGRFITSPDRTAWYATPLDRDAIDAAGPTIAGALPDGSESGIDESEIIAAGPGDSNESTRSDEDEDVATAMPGAGTETAVDEDADVDDSTGDEPVADDEPTGDTQTDSERDSGGDHEPAIDGDEDESEVEADDTADDEIPRSPDEIDVLSFDDEADDVSEDQSSADAEGESPPGDAGRETERQAGPPDEEEAGTDVPDTVDERSETEVSTLESTTDSETAGERETRPTDPEAENDGDGSAGDDADEPATDALSSFEFEEGQFEADEPDVTVEEAVDTMNEDAPAPELSNHRFDVRAEETDDGGAVLTLEFGTETIDITGSTERLLQYQMQSFAEKDSTPDADVTIGRDRIVIEIPDSDGAAIQHWGEAAVSIIDRTLYLSDNSDDS